MIKCSTRGISTEFVPFVWNGFQCTVYATTHSAVIEMKLNNKFYHRNTIERLKRPKFYFTCKLPTSKMTKHFLYSVIQFTSLFFHHNNHHYMNISILPVSNRSNTNLSKFLFLRWILMSEDASTSAYSPRWWGTNGVEYFYRLFTSNRLWNCRCGKREQNKLNTKNEWKRRKKNVTSKGISQTHRIQ